MAWRFNQDIKTWQIEDINDQQKEIKSPERVSFTIGTSLRETAFPPKVQIIQTALTLDWHYNIHNKIFKKKFL